MPLRKLNDLIGQLEGLLLTLILVVMISLSFFQVFLRNLPRFLEFLTYLNAHWFRHLAAAVILELVLLFFLSGRTKKTKGTPTNNTKKLRWISTIVSFLVIYVLVIPLSERLLAFLVQINIHPFSWGDVFVRHLVLWVGFIGASVATKEDSHLAIDLVSRFLPKWLKKPTAMFVHAASAVVCGFLAHASYKFVLGEREMHEMLMPGVPTWWAIAIIPVGFGLMSLRFAIRIYHDIRVLLDLEPLPPEKEKVA